MTGEVLTLPRWLRIFFLAVAEAPWTNIKIFNSLVATNAVLSFLAIASIFKLSLNESLVDSVLIFLASWLGIAMIGQLGKRATYKPSPPYGPDIEDAQAGATVTPAKPAPAKPLADIRGPLEAYAGQQAITGPDGTPFKGVPDDAPQSSEVGGLG